MSAGRHPVLTMPGTPKGMTMMKTFQVEIECNHETISYEIVATDRYDAMAKGEAKFLAEYDGAYVDSKDAFEI
jgi:hypothetical protein